MFKTRNIIFFLVGAAMVGFLLDARRKRVQSRTSNDEQTRFTPAVEPTAGAEFFGPPEAVG